MLKEQKPFWDKKKILSLLILFLMAVAVIITYDQKYNKSNSISKDDNPKFVISSWDFLDEYGQGIQLIEVYENSTASWVFVPPLHYYNNITEVAWNASVFIQLRVGVFLNHTLVDVVDITGGKNHIRLNVAVTSVTSILFSQQNLTYFGYDDLFDPIWYYMYEVVLNFLPVVGELYVVTVTYEVFY